jgi:hypothetical protein
MRNFLDYPCENKRRGRTRVILFVESNFKFTKLSFFPGSVFRFSKQASRELDNKERKSISPTLCGVMYRKERVSFVL